MTKLIIQSSDRLVQLDYGHLLVGRIAALTPEGEYPLAFGALNAMYLINVHCYSVAQ